jgi:hypothetical protein
MNSNQGTGGSSFPGLNSLNAFVRTYQRAWQNQVDTLNEVWGDVTRSDAKPSTWTNGFSKLLQAWSDNVTDLCGLYTGGAYGKSMGSVVTFVFDQSAEASGEPQSVPLPSDVQTGNIECTDLIRTGGGAPNIPGAHVDASPDSSGLCLEISIRDLVSIRPHPNGQYTAVVYEGSPPGNPKPPPLRALAVVVVTFI